jgi:multiple sugar transport system ATP-binding protein
MRAEISRLQRNLNVTTVYVTHDQIEAMTMGDRVAVLSRGVLQQVDTPQNLYDFPDNIFVATFIGSPQMNVLRGTFTASGDGGSIQLGDETISVPASVLQARPSLAGYSGRQLAVGIRPEHLTDTTGDNHISGTVEVREGLGSEVLMHVSVGVGRVTASDVENDTPGDDTSSIVVARFDPHTSVRKGDRVQLTVDSSKLQLFDLESGLAIR